MKRIDATDDQRFHPGDPTIRKPGTIVPAWWLNIIQEEIAAVIEKAGIPLDGAKADQLHAAISKIAAAAYAYATTSVAGLIQLATSAEVVGGTNQVKAVPPHLLRQELDKRALLQHLHSINQINGLSDALSGLSVAIGSKLDIADFLSRLISSKNDFTSGRIATVGFGGLGGRGISGNGDALSPLRGTHFIARGSLGANFWPESASGFVIHMDYNDDYCVQLMTDLNGSRIGLRGRNAGAWTAPRELAFADQIAGLGIGQAWVDVTTSRALNVTYTNTTGKPITIVLNKGDGQTTGDWVIGGVNIGASRTVSGSYQTVIVPPGATYLYTHSFAKWSELR